MAFTGTATVKYVSDSLVRITGLSLALSATGTIGLFGDSGAGVQLPEAFQAAPYGSPSGEVGLADSIEVSYWPVDTDRGTPAQIAVTKGGTPFRITMANGDSEAASSELEIYVRWHN